MSTPLYYIKKLDSDEIKDLLVRAANGGSGAGDSFFGGFNYVHEAIIGDALEGRRLGLELLKACRITDPSAYADIHKGTPYYWLGTASYRLEDYESAVFFLSAAASEDVRAGANPQSGQTPTFLFLTLDGDDPHQAAQPQVGFAQARVKEVIEYYNGLKGFPTNKSPLTLEIIREFLLRPALDQDHRRWRAIVTSFISFLLEWDYRNSLFDVLLDIGTVEPFFSHLFKGCVVFESLLKENPSIQIPSTTTTLSAALKLVAERLGLTAVPYISAVDFPTVLELLQTELQSQPLDVLKVIELTGKTRNTLGHSFGWDGVINKDQYHHLFRIVAASCLHAVACLYRW